MTKQYKSWLVLLLVFLLIDTGILNTLYLQTNQYRNTVQDADKFRHIPTGLSLINLGSSHGKFAFDYAGENAAFNAALDGQDFYYDQQVLAAALPKMKKGAVVLIPVSYFSFSYNLTDSPENFLSQNRKYYQFLKPEQIRQFSPLELLKTRIPAINAGQKIWAIIQDEAPYAYEKIDKNIYGPGKIIQAGRERGEHHLTYLLKGFRPVYIQQLRSLIICCQQNGLQPVLVTTPFTDCYNRVFSPAFYTRFHQEIAKLAGPNQPVLYLDYSHDARFQFNIDLFMDSDHLNQSGRKKFTAIILQDLRAQGMITP